MSRTIKKELLLQLRELLDLRWEFLRRNEGYRRDYAHYHQLLETHGTPEAQPVREEAFRLMAKYRLGALPDPTQGAEGIHLPIMYPYSDRPEISGFPAFKISEGQKDPYRVTLEVDLRAPLSYLVTLLSLFLEDLLGRHREHQATLAEAPGEKEQGELKIFERYLDIWDRTSAGEGPEKIARGLYPRAFEKRRVHFTPEMAVARVTEDLREAERLIQESGLLEG
jgi:hypothetical protein